MGNIVTTFRNSMVDFSSAARHQQKFLSQKHQKTNRLIMTYFYSTIVVAGLQYQIGYEEKKVQRNYHSLKDLIEKDKFSLTYDLSKEELERINY
ncbi:transmembrane protein, putative (macronuclear) [Tetrahymena thermophila SB210]|uniref:Transmembrane protein, putative n=1 Tax=Tetrahymena thermophila (strain SB210) TaxID=312017 RepID=W7XEC5_TETTS|nr:transmembrane protein, putative [Tetrahymena thermophila SB210]EWS74943.1 transmembrane protein, putative [Tetrahymena thermophila SB210]|eukprot:XP_012652532.1 transmembrane protein, putative [Tetrahymena thermophila SB210]